MSCTDWYCLGRPNLPIARAPSSETSRPRRLSSCRAESANVVVVDERAATAVVVLLLSGVAGGVGLVVGVGVATSAVARKRVMASSSRSSHLIF